MRSCLIPYRITHTTKQSGRGKERGKKKKTDQTLEEDSGILEIDC